MTTAAIELRDGLEVQYAHDTLHAVMTGELPMVEVEEPARTYLLVALDALCWVLKHDHNTSFAQNLERVRETIRDAGYEERRLPVPMTLGERRRMN